MIHYFSIDAFRRAITADLTTQFGSDSGDGAIEDGVLDEVREQGETYTDSHVAGAGYDPSVWQVDSDGDGISDNVPAILRLISLNESIYFLGLRRNEMPDNFERRFLFAEKKLAEILAGTLPLINETTTDTVRTFSNNMEESDLGELTQKGGTEDLPWAGYQ